MPYLDNPAVEPLHAANVGMAESDAEQNQEVEQKAVKVAISGYGPFRNIPVNPSGRCVKRLQETCADLQTSKGKAIQLDCSEIPVVYDDVERYCSLVYDSELNDTNISSKYDLYIHVGVSALRPHISLESRARRFDYSAADARGQNATPLLLGDPDRKQAGFIGRGWDEEDLKPEYKTILPVSKIASTLNGKWRTDVKVSSDAGLYLCEYVYYCSMAHAQKQARSLEVPPKPVLFVHIPMPRDEEQLQECTSILKDIVCTVVEDCM